MSVHIGIKTFERKGVNNTLTQIEGSVSRVHLEITDKLEMCTIEYKMVNLLQKNITKFIFWRK